MCSLGAEGYLDWDTLMVCTCRYSKMTYAFPCHSSINSQQAAELFHKKIVLELGFGIPIAIYSDMDPTLRSEFARHFSTWNQLPRPVARDQPKPVTQPRWSGYEVELRAE